MKTIPNDLNEVADQVSELAHTLDVSRRMSPRSQLKMIQDTSIYLFQLAEYLKRKADVEEQR